MAAQSGARIPILLLKTRSAPVDAYQDFFTDSEYDPVFVPVLEHRCKEDVLNQIRQDITACAFVPDSRQGGQKYGAIIFTSQRAVEAFSRVVEELREEGSRSIDELLPESLPLYVVGPATARQLRALRLQCPILGEETGNGEALASFMLEHYNGIYNDVGKPSLLFLVGDKRRDIIPTTLQSESLPAERRCKVEEVVVYETGEMLSFKSNFTSIWKENSKNGRGRQWVVVFSPTGCKAMLESLGLLDEQTGKLRVDPVSTENVYIATIGPTTRDYLQNEFGFSPNVCAETPTPEGIADGIKAFSVASGL